MRKGVYDADVLNNIVDVLQWVLSHGHLAAIDKSIGLVVWRPGGENVCYSQPTFIHNAVLSTQVWIKGDKHKLSDYWCHGWEVLTGYGYMDELRRTVKYCSYDDTRDHAITMFPLLDELFSKIFSSTASNYNQACRSTNSLFEILYRSPDTADSGKNIMLQLDVRLLRGTIVYVALRGHHTHDVLR